MDGKYNPLGTVVCAVYATHSMKDVSYLCCHIIIMYYVELLLFIVQNHVVSKSAASAYNQNWSQLHFYSEQDYFVLQYMWPSLQKLTIWVQKINDFLILFCHNFITIYTTTTKSSSLLQSLMDFLLQLTELGYYILSEWYYSLV